MPTDTELLNWISAPGRWVTQQDQDKILSYFLERKTVHFYINGRYTQVDGDTLKEALVKAMQMSDQAYTH